MEDEVVSRRNFIRDGALAVGTFIIAACGGGGGGEANGIANETVLQRTIRENSNVETNGNYVVRVGSMQANDSHGLIFKVNGIFPPDNGDTRWAHEYILKAGDSLAWELVTR